MAKSKRRKNGTKKYGRNKAKCEKYRRQKRHERSHVKRILRHIKKYKDSSPMAKNALEKYQKLLIG